MSDIFLIFPPSVYRNHTPPLNLAYIAASLENDGHKVTIADLSALNNPIDEETLFAMIRSTHPLWIGLTLNVIFIKPAYELISRLKQFGIPIVVGGPHPSLLAEECLNNGCDYVIRGEGELTSVELTRCLLSNENLNVIDGLSYKDASGEIHHNKTRSLMTELDRLPFPAKHLFPKEWYCQDSKDYQVYGPIFSGRGCPANCHYCYKGVFGHGCRIRSAENVFEEMLFLRKTYSVTAFEFMDDAFSADLHRVSRLCELISSDPMMNGIRWQCTTRLDLTTRELLMDMKKSGCFRIFYGVESGDPDTLNRVNKHLDLDKAIQVLKWTREAGIRSIAGFMWGFPWDSPSSVNASIQLLKKLAPFTDEFNPLGILIPVPGTHIYDWGKDRYGFDRWWMKDRFGHRYRSNAYFPFFQKRFYNDFSLLDDGFFPFPQGVKRMIRKGIFTIGRHNLYANNSFVKASLLFIACLFSRILYRIYPPMEETVFRALSRVGKVRG